MTCANSWRQNLVPVVLERFLLPALAAIWVLIVATNPMQWDIYQRLGGGLVVVGVALFIGAAVHRWNSKPEGPETLQKTEPAPMPEQPRSSKWKTAPLGTVKTFELHNGDLLVFRGPLGVAVAAVTFSGTCRATYEWRYQRGDGAGETRGNGELFEQYATKADQTETREVVDVGGRLWIIAGPYRVQWSCPRWIYPRPNEFEVYKMTGTSLESFRF